MHQLPPFRLDAVPENDAASEAQGFEWAAEGVGTRHRLGGSPSWLLEDATPYCPACGDRMTFYGQLDSIGDDVSLADAGIIYVFACFKDFETASVLQSG